MRVRLPEKWRGRLASVLDAVRWVWLFFRFMLLTVIWILNRIDN